MQSITYANNPAGEGVLPQQTLIYPLWLSSGLAKITICVRARTDILDDIPVG